MQNEQRTNSKKKKQVTFAEGTYSPPPSEICPTCGYRNIKPKIRDMAFCVDCYNRVCSECLTTMLICRACFDELFQEEPLIDNDDSETDIIDDTLDDDITDDSANDDNGDDNVTLDLGYFI